MKKFAYIFLGIIILIFLIWYFTKPIKFHPALLQVLEKEDIISSEMLSWLDEAKKSKQPNYTTIKKYELPSHFIVSAVNATIIILLFLTSKKAKSIPHRRVILIAETIT